MMTDMPPSLASAIHDIIKDRLGPVVRSGAAAARLRNNPVNLLAYIAHYIGPTGRSELVRAAALLVAAIEILDKEGK